MHPWIAGALAGTTATVPMTAVMFAWRRMLPPLERYAVPPEEITTKLAERTGAADALDHDRTALKHRPSW